MDFGFLLLYVGLSFINVVIQTVKSLCTVKSSTFVSACVNAVAYGLYVYVIFFTNAEGLPLWGKAIVTACANFTGVYLANFLFNNFLRQEVMWRVEVSVPVFRSATLQEKLKENNLGYFFVGTADDWVSYVVFCPTGKESATLKSILPPESKHNVNEVVKRL